MKHSRRIGAVLVVLALLVAGGGAAEARSARTWVVGATSAACPTSDFTDVATAVTAAAAGDTVRLCPGTYPDPVTVGQHLTLEGPLAPLSPDQCLAVSSSDPTSQAVLTGGVVVAADGVTVRGLVVDSTVTGIATISSVSGYRITGNLVRGSGALGIEVESNGAHLSRVDHNCVRDKTGGAIVSEDGPLRWARIDGNVTSGNNESVTALGEYVHDRIVIDGNQSVGDSFGIAITSSTRSAITRNRIDGRRIPTFSTGINIKGGNSGLLVAGNDSSNSTLGLAFDRTGANFEDPRPNTGLVITGNSFHDNVGVGSTVLLPVAGAPSNQLRRSVIAYNTYRDNGASGLVLGRGDDDNVIYRNTSVDNGRNGIILNGSTGSVVAANTMTGNAVFDAVDASSPLANQWVANDCITDNPDGLCGGNPASVPALPALPDR